MTIHRFQLAILLSAALLAAPVFAQAPADDPFGGPAKAPPPAAKPGDMPPVFGEPFVIQQFRDSNPTTPEQLMVAAHTVLQYGRPDECKRYLAKLLAAKPPEDDLAAIPQQVGSALLMRLSTEPQVQPEGKQLAELAFAAADKMLRDPGRINSYIAQLSDPDLGNRSLALSKLSESGTHVVTPILRVLADAGREKEHVYLRAALAHMKAVTEGPMLGALDITNDYLKAQVILVLGKMNSQKAVRHLVRSAVDPAVDEGVRQAAIASLTRLVGPIPTQYEAEKYLAGEIKTLLEGRVPLKMDENDQVEVWLWDETNREVASRKLPPGDVAAVLAARLANDLYALKADNNAALRLNLMTNLEVAQVLAGLSNAIPMGKGSAGAMAVKAGPEVVNQVLADAIKLGRIPAAIAAANVLGVIGDPAVLHSAGAADSPLATALVHSDRRVRLAAALTCLRLSPSEPFPGASRVMDTLGRTLATTGADRVLVAHPRGEDAQSLIGFMNELGYEGDAAHTGKRLVELALAGVDYDFLLISDAIDSPPVKELVQWLRRDYRTAGLPIGLMARGEDLYSLRYAVEDDKLSIVFPRLHSTEVAAVEVDRILAIAGRNRVTRDERLAMARVALDALASLAQSPAGYKVFDVLRQETAVISALNTPNLADKAARVLGLLGTPKSQTALVDFASQNTRPLASRQAAVAAFDAAVKSRGLNLTQVQIAEQFNRYNASAALDKPTQEMLGAILDIIEAPTAAKENAISQK